MILKKIAISDAFRLILCLFLPLYVSVFGALATFSSINTWYPSLVKPFFNPPNWIFGPVWTVLYILMGISLFIIWENGLEKENSRIAILIFMCQLAINLLWSYAFFGFMSPILGLFMILILWPLILLMIINFYHISKVAAYISIPYLVWVSFATILNLAIVILN